MTEQNLKDDLKFTLAELEELYGWNVNVVQRPDGGVTIGVRQPDQKQPPQISLIESEEGDVE